jgi:phosphopantetheine--protein transferase-like protein
MKILGIGIDLEPVDSFRRKKFASCRRFYSRLFSSEEIEYCRKHRDPAPRFTARFCAKEAVVKAVRPILSMSVFDSEIRNDRSGAPKVVLRSKKPALRRFFAQHEILISISHTDKTAVAFAILVRKGKAP